MTIKGPEESHQLAPVKLANGECGLFVWTGTDKKFRFYSQGQNNIRLSKDSGTVFLQREGIKAEIADIFGQYPNGSFIDAAGRNYTLTFTEVDIIGESIRYSKGSLRSEDENGWERMEAAFGVSSCQRSGDLPIESSLSASRLDLVRPLGLPSKQVSPTAQITMTPASLYKETTRVLSVPVVTKIERPLEHALPPVAPIHRAAIGAVKTQLNQTVDVETPPPTGPYYVQLASYLSEDRAQRAWSELSTQHNILTNAKHDIIAAQIPNKGLYFRLQLGGYKSQSVASSYCEGLKNHGLDCFVALRKF